MRSTVTIHIASWEIECCAPPPAVGHSTSWRLTFAPDPGGEPWPGRDEHAVRAAGAVVIVDDVVPAHWRGNLHGPAPASTRLWGGLHGTAHGGVVPDDVPLVTGRVERVRVVRCRYATTDVDGRSRLEAVRGSTTVTDVRESPRWFTWPSAGSDEPGETGVLVDVHIPAASVEARRPPS